MNTTMRKRMERKGEKAESSRLADGFSRRSGGEGIPLGRKAGGDFIDVVKVRNEGGGGRGEKPWDNEGEAAERPLFEGFGGAVYD